MLLKRASTSNLVRLSSNSTESRGIWNLVQSTTRVFPCFDLVLNSVWSFSMSSYVQSRGRARHRDAKYIIFVERQDTQQTDQVQHINDAEVLLKKTARGKWVFSSLSKALEKENEDFEKDILLFADQDEVFTVPATQAIATLRSSVSLLYR